MTEGNSWTPGDALGPTRAAVPPQQSTEQSPVPPPAQPQAGQLYGWDAPASPPATASYGPTPTYGAPPAGSPYDPPPATGYPAAPTYVPPPPGQPPYGPAGYPPPGYGPLPYPPLRKPGTDGFAVAALVLGLVGGTFLAIGFGIAGLVRIKSSGQKGRGMAIAGIVLGSVVFVGGIAAAIAIPVFLNQRTQAMHEQCASGDMAACDRLFEAAPDGSDEQAWADTCGGRTQGGTLCTEVSGVFTYGDDADLDALWDACGSGDMASCDLLYDSSEPGSDYEWFGATCGNRTDGTMECALAEQDT